MQPSDLKTPLLLLAMPQVVDPFFYRSVVLLIHHEDKGSQGFIVNRPTGVKISDILEDVEVPWLSSEGARAFFGGPVQPQRGTLLYRSEDTPSSESQLEISPGIVLTQNVSDLQSLAETPPSTFRLLLGYAGWDQGQLVKEILRNDWLIAEVHTDFLFGDDSEAIWRQAIESMGIDPTLLPSWTADGGDASAN